MKDLMGEIKIGLTVGIKLRPDWVKEFMRYEGPTIGKVVVIIRKHKLVTVESFKSSVKRREVHIYSQLWN